MAGAWGALDSEAEMASSGRSKYESILLIHSFLHLKGIYEVPGTILGLIDVTSPQTNKKPSRHGVCILLGRNRQ